MKMLFIYKCLPCWNRYTCKYQNTLHDTKPGIISNLFESSVLEIAGKPNNFQHGAAVRLLLLDVGEVGGRFEFFQRIFGQ